MKNTYFILIILKFSLQGLHFFFFFNLCIIFCILHDYATCVENDFWYWTLIFVCEQEIVSSLRCFTRNQDDLTLEQYAWRVIAPPSRTQLLALPELNWHSLLRHNLGFHLPSQISGWSFILFKLVWTLHFLQLTFSGPELLNGC